MSYKIRDLLYDISKECCYGIRSVMTCKTKGCTNGSSNKHYCIDCYEKLLAELTEPEVARDYVKACKLRCEYQIVESEFAEAIVDNYGDSLK